MTNLIEQLGITKEELQQRVVDKIVSTLMETIGFEEDDGGGEHSFVAQSPLAARLEKSVKEVIDSKVGEIAAAHVLPKVTAMCESLVLTETTKWGEKIGTPISFTDYMVKRAEEYLKESVSFEGKSKQEAGAYSWNGTQTRITYLVHQHLHYSMETVVKEVMKNGITTVAQAVHETVRLKLNEVAAGMKIEVKTK